jgi:phytoene/squalene synthetase
VSQASFAYCEALVRKTDKDRYLADLFAPAPLRPHLFALHAFAHEIAKIAWSVSQPIAGQIRLQWWRDAIEAIFAGDSRAHEVVQALGLAVRAHKLPRSLFDAMIDAREHDLEPSPFTSLAALKAYADATSGHPIRLAARILGAGDTLDRAAGHAGIAYALAGLLRAIPFHAASGRSILPADLVRGAGLHVDAIRAGEGGPDFRALVANLADAARAEWRTARGTSMSRAYLPAFLPAALVPLYLKALLRPGNDLFRDVPDVPVYRRQIAMLRAVLLGVL